MWTEWFDHNTPCYGKVRLLQLQLLLWQGVITLKKSTKSTKGVILQQTQQGDLEVHREHQAFLETSYTGDSRCNSVDTIDLCYMPPRIFFCSKGLGNSVFFCFAPKQMF